jgi:parallel beta-helix repeat protein
VRGTGRIFPVYGGNMNGLSKAIKRPRIMLLAALVIGSLMLVAIVAPLATDAYSTGFVLMRKKASIALTGGSSDVKVGGKIHISGQLSGISDKAYEKISLAITLPDGSVTYPSQGKSTYTSKTGTFSIDFVPKVAGKHTFSATYGDHRNGVVAKKDINVLAAKAPEAKVPVKSATSLALTLGSSSITLGEGMHADGKLTSGGVGVVGVPVSVRITLPSGSSINMDRSQIMTGPEGTFAVDYTPTVVGTYGLSATYAGSSKYNASTTSVSFVVTPAQPTPLIKTSMSLTPSSASIETGKNMHASGLLKGSAGVAGATVALRVTLPDGSTAYPVQGSSVTTQSDGTFAVDYTPTQAGSYKLTATFAGNNQYDASTVTATFTATSPPPADPGTDPGTNPGSGTVTTGSYDYLVTASGSTYTTKSASGTTVYSGSNPTTAIQTALNSLTQGRTVKQTVLLQGTFSITKAISIPSYTILKLDGKVEWGSSSVGYILTASNKNNIEVRGGEWDGNRDMRSMTSSSNPMYFYRCTDVIIADLKVYDGTYDNIEFEYSERITITGVESYNTNWNSIILAYCNNCVVENSYIHDSDQGGCYFYCEDDGIAQTINNNIIRNCRVERTLTSGLSFSIRGVEDRTDGGLIEGNTVIDCGRDTDHPGINIGWGSKRLATNTVVRNNVIYSTTSLGEGGIEFAGNGCVCEGNIIYDTPGYAIHLVGTNNRVIGNTITNAGWSDGGAGIAIEGSGNIVTDNTIKNCRTYGISGSSGNTVSPNTFSGNGRNVR